MMYPKNTEMMSGEADSEDDLESLESLNGSGDEGDDDDWKHGKLLDAISALDGKKRAGRQRTEPAAKASEFHVTAGKDKLQLHELMGALQKTTGHGQLKKDLSHIRKRGKPLEAPLPRIQREKIERTVSYGKTTEEVSKWDPIVEKNRTAEQVTFPLQQPDLKVHSGEFIKRFKAHTPLELEVAKLLSSNKDDLLTEKAELTAAERRALKAMDLEEAKERRAELAKYRALLSYQAAKAKRQKKIKSKRYHRILRKDKVKQEKKALEGLKQNDPEAYLEKLKRIEKNRVEERMSLKHRGGSKFMKRQAVFGKYDDQSRHAVQEMIQKNKELTQKMAVESESEEEEAEGDIATEEITEETNDGGKVVSNSTSNPWMQVVPAKRKKLDPALVSQKEKSGKKDESVIPGESERHSEVMIVSPELVESGAEESCGEDEGNFSSRVLDEADIDDIFKSLEDEQTHPRKANYKKPKHKSVKTESLLGKRKRVEGEKTTDERTGNKDSNTLRVEKDKLSGNEEEGQQDDGHLSESLTRKQTLEDFEGNWDDDEQGDSVEETEDLPVQEEKTEEEGADSGNKEDAPKQDIQVDPDKFFTVDHKIRHTHEPDLVTDDEDEDVDAEQQQRMTIAQAFAEDDVMEQFDEEKDMIEKRDTIQDIDLTLPGWGDWGGSGLEPSKSKTKRFIIKAPETKRKDKGLKGVIINQNKDTAIAKYQVKSLPTMYRSMRQFEKSIMTPVGSTWNPESSFKDMIKPKVRTQIGQVIQPIDKAAAFKKHKATKEPTSDPKNKNKGQTFKRRQRNRGNPRKNFEKRQ